MNYGVQTNRGKEKKRREKKNRNQKPFLFCHVRKIARRVAIFEIGDGFSPRCVHSLHLCTPTRFHDRVLNSWKFGTDRRELEMRTWNRMEKAKNRKAREKKTMRNGIEFQLVGRMLTKAILNFSVDNMISLCLCLVTLSNCIRFVSIVRRILSIVLCERAQALFCRFANCFSFRLTFYSRQFIVAI